MAVFGPMTLTNAGQVLYAKIQAGTETHFTRMQLGSGQLSEGQDPATFTALITPAMYVPISSIVANSTLKIAQISALINNSGISTTTYVCEIGLFAQDPDLGEILYGYANAGTQGDYFSPASEGAFSWSYQINAAIGNATSVTVNTSNVTNDYTLLNTNTFSILAGDNQMALNKNIDNIFKPYTTTHSGNAYSVTIPDFDFADGYPICIKFDAASTGAITLNANNSSAKAVVDYFGNQVTNVRAGLIANIRYDAANSNFQLLGKGGDGDATASQLLYNKKATVRTGPITGAMPDKSSGEYAALNLTTYDGGLGTRVYFKVPEGYYKGRTDGVWDSYSNVYSAPYPDLKIENIVNGKSFLGLTGTATIQSLGGRQFVTGTISIVSGTPSVSGLPFTPAIVVIYLISTTADGNDNYHGLIEVYNNTGDVSVNGITGTSGAVYNMNGGVYGENAGAITVSGNSFTGKNTGTYACSYRWIAIGPIG